MQTLLPLPLSSCMTLNESSVLVSLNFFIYNMAFPLRVYCRIKYHFLVQCVTSQFSVWYALVLNKCSRYYKNTPQRSRLSWDHHYLFMNQLTNDINISCFFSTYARMTCYHFCWLPAWPTHQLFHPEPQRNTHREESCIAMTLE